MANNLVVDVNHINDALTKLDKLYNAAAVKNYYVRTVDKSTFESSPLNLSGKDFKIEAVAIPQGRTWYGWGGGTISYKYNFVKNFSNTPVVCVTYDGKYTTGVTASIELSTPTQDDVLTIHLTKKTGKWAHDEDHFYVHVIAMGH